ncbi:MAG TPA: hypothetical protein VGG87_04860 [Solirubrobacteraceae bacterium]|jgi:hypothetical protein
MELGAPISYEVLEPGTPVLTSDGHELGKVAVVLADEGEDVFDGIVVDTRAGAGGHRFADADVVGEIREHGVVLKLDREGAASLPEPSANPAVMTEDPADPQSGVSGQIEDKLRRAWDWISGNY